VGQLLKSEVVFLTVCSMIIGLVATNQIVFFLLALLILLLASGKLGANNNELIYDRRFLKAFLLVFATWYLLIILSRVIGLEGLTNNQIRLYYQLPSILSILLMYVYGVKFSDFNWNLRVIDIVVVIMVFVLVEFYALFIELDMTLGLIFKSFVLHILYPSFVEEMIFRGLLLTGLLSLGVDIRRANLYQALLFGIMHVHMYEYILIISLLKSSVQVFMGYIFGKLYIESKSLTPCILLHSLLDTI
jgi:hypothetical protein